MDIPDARAGREVRSSGPLPPTPSPRIWLHPWTVRLAPVAPPEKNLTLPYG
ncbi:hypothetical protein [Streptomyces sp. NPDC006527]|uniref:hypothetical protein n=1 Tax=Streptomyces sp. NPDC006527 TaxID=3364749 RepID=UPI0036D112F7